MTRRRLWLRRFGIAALAVLAAQQIWRHGHDYVFPEEFYVVEPGRLYRGAWQQDWPMRRIVRDHKIQTVVALAHRPQSPMVAEEKALADELGVRFVHIPITEYPSADGERAGVGESLERAADALADPAHGPVYFHCHHGRNRASMVQIAYRTLHCGWTLERALAEIENSIGLVEVSKGVDYRDMAAFYRDRVLPRRAQAAATAAEAATRR